MSYSKAEEKNLIDSAPITKEIAEQLASQFGKPSRRQAADRDDDQARGDAGLQPLVVRHQGRGRCRHEEVWRACEHRQSQQSE